MIVPKGTQKTNSQAAICGFFAGSCEAVVISPFDLVKVRLQAANRSGIVF